MLDKLIRPPNLNHWSSNSFLIQQLEHCAAIAAHQNVVFERYRQVGGASKEFGRAGIQRLDKASIDQRNIVTIGGKLLGSFLRQTHHISKREKGDFAAAII